MAAVPARSGASLTVEWQDNTSRRVIEPLKRLRVKKVYMAEDVEGLLDEHFDE